MQSWPCGHATDSEDTIQFMDLQKIDCMVQTFPLAKANEAFSKLALTLSRWNSRQVWMLMALRYYQRRCWTEPYASEQSS